LAAVIVAKVRPLLRDTDFAAYVELDARRNPRGSSNIGDLGSKILRVLPHIIEHL
jgi:hypothetical protein